MATIINTPGGGSDDNSGWGFVLGILIIIVLAVLFFVYALPYLRRSNTQPAQPSGGTNINVTVPNPTSGTNPNPGTNPPTNNSPY